MSSDSTRPRRRRKVSGRPKKPYAEYPLYPHPLGYWSRKVAGRLLHFGRWGRVVKGKLELLPYEENWQAALRAYKARVDDAQAGRIRETVVQEKPEPVSTDSRLTLAELCDRFLTSKLRKLESGELAPRSLAEFRQATDLLIVKFKKHQVVDELTPEDFGSLRVELAKRWGPVRLTKFISMIRSIFTYAVTIRRIDRPVAFGEEFNRPDKRTMRKHKAASGKKLFTADELRQCLDKASPPLKAAILLGINAGCGNSDIANLQFRNVDLDAAWLDYPREKTGMARRCPLWPETTMALRAAIAERPQPKSTADKDCIFITPYGSRWVRNKQTFQKVVAIDAIGMQFGKLLRDLKINGRRGLGFYALRHTFATTGLQTGDRDAVRALMGHAAHDMLSAYDETGPSDERLKKVVSHVHAWLFGQEGGAK